VVAEKKIDPRGAGLRAELLKLADEELMVGHILTSLAGWGPELEINLVLSSAGQEELGHARLFYSMLYGDDSDAINAAIYRRDAPEFRSCALAERYAEDWGELVVKQYLYDTADDYRLTALASAGMDPAAIEGVRAEERFQREFWSYWFQRIASAGIPARERLQRALTSLWPLTGALFEVENGVSGNRAALSGAREAWRDSVRLHCAELGLELPDTATTEADGDGRKRVLAELRSVHDDAPGQW